MQQFRALHVVDVRLEQLRVPFVQFGVLLLQFRFALLQTARMFHGILMFQFQHSDDTLERFESCGQFFAFALRSVLELQQLLFGGFAERFLPFVLRDELLVVLSQEFQFDVVFLWGKDD